MAEKFTAFSTRDIASRDRLEDYSADAVVTTAGGLTLHVAIVADGAGGGEAGELAARLTAKTILEAIQISTETNVPRMLARSVERANAVVYSELRGAGTSTVGVLAVHVTENNPNGRLYVASVGDTRLFLVRDGKLARLNIDHTLANEYIYAGQMSAEEARLLDNADYVTRSIGVSNDVHVDIGIYAERGRPFVTSRRAFRIGQAGVALREGDTLLAASDGLFEVSKVDNKPFLREDEILRHGLDDNVERAGQSLMRYATGRSPGDNIAISMLFVDSPRRRPVRFGSGLTRAQRIGFGVTAAIVSLVIIFLFTQFLSAESRRVTIENTQTAIQDAVVRLSWTATALTHRQPLTDGDGDLYGHPPPDPRRAEPSGHSAVSKRNPERGHHRATGLLARA
ncbi:MAG: protein serine/threonine phosphatase [Chloroflexi bacterium OLB13]|nr:MAG: protein serine/threonine phosphatase [Chloroflexi bacterium OLB13]